MKPRIILKHRLDFWLAASNCDMKRGSEASRLPHDMVSYSNHPFFKGKLAVSFREGKFLMSLLHTLGPFKERVYEVYGFVPVYTKALQQFYRVLKGGGSKGRG